MDPAERLEVELARYDWTGYLSKDPLVYLVAEHHFTKVIVPLLREVDTETAEKLWNHYRPGEDYLYPFYK